MKHRSLIMLLWVGLLFSGEKTIANTLYEFKILAVSGQCFITNDKGTKHEIHIGAMLSKGEKLEIYDDSYIGLMHRSGKTIELNTKGEYLVDDLVKQIEVEMATVTQKYATYVVEKWDSEKSDIENEYRKYLNVTGSVERGDGNSLHLKLPRYVDVLNPVVIVSWNALEGQPTYSVVVKNMYGKVIFSKNTSNTTYDLNLLNTEIAKEDIVIVSVKSGNNIISDDYAIKLIKDERAERLKKEMSFIKNISGTKSSIGCLALASFYEENNLIADAMMEYQNAKSLSPESPQFETAFNAFMSRHAL